VGSQPSLSQTIVDEETGIILLIWRTHIGGREGEGVVSLLEFYGFQQFPGAFSGAMHFPLSM